MKSQLAEFGAIIAVGGNDTLSVLTRLLEFQGIRIAVPKTLDNDLMGTDYTLGHWSVVEYLVGAILRARYSTLDHHRFLVVETIGQDAGWVALRAGRAVGADSIIIPEMGVSLPDVVKAIAERPTGLVVLTSSARILGLETPEAEVTAGDGFGNPHYEDRRIGHLLAARIHAEFGFDARCEVLTDSVRGGSTSSFDLLLAQRFANSAINVLSRLGPNKCVMLGLKGYRIEMSVLDQAPGRKFVAAEDILAL
jgi:6-phosphofructokinase 1